MGSPKGRIAWNKGLKKCFSEETLQKMRDAKLKNPTRYWLDKKMSKETKRKISDTKIGTLPWNTGLSSEEQPTWKGGCVDYWSLELKKVNKECVLCGSNIKLEMHHKDKDRTNNERNNLIIICRNCHSFWHKK